MAKKKASTKDSKKKAPAKAARSSRGAKPAARAEAVAKSSGGPRASNAKPARLRAGAAVARGNAAASLRLKTQVAPAAAARSKSDGAQLKKLPAKPTNKRISSADLSRIRSVLSQKRLAISNHLQNELTELEKPEKRHRADLEEIASDTHDTDSLCEIMDIEATQIDQIEMALAKIDNGTYGVCEDCGKEIPLPRLEALPFATQCIDCKRRAEIQGQIAASDSSSASAGSS